MNYKRLSEEITDVVVEALNHFEHLDKRGQPLTFNEAQESIVGGVHRYRNDPIFRAKSQMLVASILAVVSLQEKSS